MAKKTTGQPSLTATPKKINEGLRKPQVRVLTALSKAKQPLSRAEISEKAKVDLPMLNSYIGANDPKVRAKNDKRYKCLLTLGYVKTTDGDGRGASYSITASGKKALDSAAKE